MSNRVVPVSVKGVMPTVNGCAVFLGNDDKAYVIYVDHSVGNAISMALNGVKKDTLQNQATILDLQKQLEIKKIASAYRSSRLTCIYIAIICLVSKV